MATPTIAHFVLWCTLLRIHFVVTWALIKTTDPLLGNNNSWTILLIFIIWMTTGLVCRLQAFIWTLSRMAVFYRFDIFVSGTCGRNCEFNILSSPPTWYRNCCWMRKVTTYLAVTASRVTFPFSTRVAPGNTLFSSTTNTWRDRS